MPDFEHLTDADLVAAFRGGDNDAFAEVYDRYAERIYSYCLTMLRKPDDAADATRDTFVKAAKRLEELERTEKLRPWLFAMARSETRAEGRRRRLVSQSDDLTEVLVDDPELTTRPRQAELRTLVWEAADSLSERDQQLMALHLVEGLEGEDLVLAMGMEPANLDVQVPRMRERVERAMGGLVLARLGNPDCGELAAILAQGGGPADPDTSSRVTGHIAGCDICEARRSVLLAPAAALTGIMLAPPPDDLRERVLADVAPGEAAVVARKGPSDLAMWAVFGVVTILLGLIGMNVGARFTPLDPGVSPQEGPPVGAETVSTTSTTMRPTTTTDPVSTTNAQSVGAATITVVTETIDYGDDEEEGSFEISNSGQVAGTFAVSSSSEHLILAAGQGEVGPGETLEFAVNLDRSSLPEGEVVESVTVTWDGGQKEIDVIGTHVDNPIIHNPQASPSSLVVDGASACSPTTSTVSARITDTSPFVAVVRWSPDGVGTTETPMAEAGGEIYEADIGPFSAAQTADIRIVATDELGNAGGTRITVDVAACP